MPNRKPVTFKIGSSGSFSPSSSAYASRVRRQMAQVVNNLEKVVGNLTAATPVAIFEALQPTFQKAKVYTPRETGRMVASGYLEITNRGERPRVEMGFARGGQPDYTVLQHENLEFFHTPPTRAKFLQSAVNEDMGKFLTRIGDSLGKEFNQ